MAEPGSEAAGFIGLGLMGSAIASRLLTAQPLVVWNRTPAACEPLAAAGAEVARTAAEVFARCRTVFVMVTDEGATDDILSFDEGRLRERTLVQMSTVSPAHSAALNDRVMRAGGRYVEAPVSGSRQPALSGQLVGLLAGDPEAMGEVAEMLRPACGSVYRCGTPPEAMQMKLAVNVFLIALVTGLAESFHFAEGHGLDVELLGSILASGPMSSAVSEMKSGKLLKRDFSAQAAVADVLKNAELVTASAAGKGIEAVLLNDCARLFSEASALGHGNDDMVAVISAYRARTAALRGARW